MVVHPFILGSIYIFIGVLEAPAINKKRKLLYIFITTFLGVYAEWIGVFVAFWMCVVLLFLCIRNRRYFVYIPILTLGTLLPVGLTLVHYSQISGFETLMEHTKEKYKQRSGLDNSAEGGYSFGDKRSLNRIYGHYDTNYAALLDYAWLCLYLLAFLLIANRFKKRQLLSSTQKIIAFIIFCSIITHHLAFFNFTVVHDFSTLKSSIFLCLFIPWCLHSTITFFESKKIQTYLLIASVLLSGWFIHWSLNDYYWVNRKDKGTYDQMIAGEAAKKYAKDDEVVFSNALNSPVLWWYARRNVLPVLNTQDCINFLRYTKYEKGVFIRLREKDREFFVDAIRINSEGDSTRVN
jgi:hypothetical protein